MPQTKQNKKQVQRNKNQQNPTQLATFCSCEGNNKKGRSTLSKSKQILSNRNRQTTKIYNNNISLFIASVYACFLLVSEANHGWFWHMSNYCFVTQPLLAGVLASFSMDRTTSSKSTLHIFTPSALFQASKKITECWLVLVLVLAAAAFRSSQLF